MARQFTLTAAAATSAEIMRESEQRNDCGTRRNTRTSVVITLFRNNTRCYKSEEISGGHVPAALDHPVRRLKYLVTTWLLERINRATAIRKVKNIRPCPVSRTTKLRGGLNSFANVPCTILSLDKTRYSLEEKKNQQFPMSVFVCVNTKWQCNANAKSLLVDKANELSTVSWDSVHLFAKRSLRSGRPKL